MVAKTKNSDDKEWINLMLAAKRLNITPDEIRHFFKQTGKERNDSSVASSPLKFTE
ncbi:protein sinI [Pueribacillus theae]|uniref:Protein sinI n=1 Tax=Pueribacillus theae TaxID=2171751 RepID=A0A2U1JSU0_9BACI|nr:anti-repressor SinI family protein [Pueribacillus theae]PWA08266.1 protein sinI [Pueribacillus theae]